MTILRIIDDRAHSPGFNMAADLYCLEECQRAPIVFFRLYEWNPPCITIGYMQKAREILDLKRMEKDGVAWIRRPTGGRAVLHEGDITYSCIFPASIAEMGKNIMESYGVITRCLMAGLELAGVTCSSNDSFDGLRDTKREIKLPCFLAPNRKEIMVSGRKLVGSAQKRGAGAVLQHGSIPFTTAYRKLPDYVLLSDEQRQIQKDLLRGKSICLNEIDPGITLDRARKAILEGVAQSLPFEVVQNSWTDEEMGKIETLANSKEFGRQWME
jgi:lipoyl(octanoyl) transferase